MVYFFWLSQACYQHGTNWFFLLPVFQLCDFCDSKSNKIGISFHPEVLPFHNLLSAALNPCVSLQCYHGDPAAPQCCSGHWGETMDLMCPDAEHAALARGASCKAAITIWAEKKASSGAAGLLLRDRSPLSWVLPSMPLNGAEQHCTVL